MVDRNEKKKKKMMLLKSQQVMSTVMKNVVSLHYNIFNNNISKSSY